MPKTLAPLGKFDANGMPLGDGGSAMVPWVFVMLSYIHQFAPPKCPVDIPMSAPVERKKALLLAKLNAFLGTEAVDLAQLRDYVEYRYGRGTALVPRIKFTEEQFRTQIQVYVYKYGRITMQAFKGMLLSQEKAEAAQAAPQPPEALPKREDAGAGVAPAAVAPASAAGPGGGEAAPGGPEKAPSPRRGPADARAPGAALPPRRGQPPRRVSVTFLVHPAAVGSVVQEAERLSLEYERHIYHRWAGPARRLPPEDPGPASSQAPGAGRPQGGPQGALAASGRFQAEDAPNTPNAPYVPQFPVPASFGEAG